MAHHSHHHARALTSLNRAFIAGIALNLLFVAAELVAGVWYDSVGLLSDAGHNLSDVACLALAMIAFRMARVRPNAHYTYGLKKSTVLVALTNAVILLVAVGIIISESISKFIAPQHVDGTAVAWVAGAGVGVNAFTAWLFMRDKQRDLNVKGAYLHMAADALVSVGVVISGIVIARTGWYVIDPIVGLAIAVVILYSTWGLLHDSVRMALDGVPSSVDTGQIGLEIASTPGVRGWHHLHIWPLSTTETALTAHIVVAHMDQAASLKETLKERLAAKGITHATLEFETAECPCSQRSCPQEDKK